MTRLILWTFESITNKSLEKRTIIMLMLFYTFTNAVYYTLFFSKQVWSVRNVWIKYRKTGVRSRQHRLSGNNQWYSLLVCKVPSDLSRLKSKVSRNKVWYNFGLTFQKLQTFWLIVRNVLQLGEASFVSSLPSLRLRYLSKLKQVDLFWLFGCGFNLQKVLEDRNLVRNPRAEFVGFPKILTVVKCICINSIVHFIEENVKANKET